MTEAPLQTAVTDKSSLRFSIRTLLWVMVAVAVVTGTVGPYFRRLEEVDQRFVGRLWLTALGGLAVLVAWHVWRRIRLEQMAGPLISLAAPRGSWQRKIRPWQLVVGSAFWVLLGVYFLFIASVFPNEPGFPGAFILGLISVLMMSAGISGIVWRRSIQIRENGVLYGLCFLRWSHVTRCRWDDENVHPPGFTLLKNCVLVEGVDQRHEDCRLQMYIEDVQLPRIRHILRTRLPRRARLWSDSEADDAMTVVHSAYIPINDRKDFTSRGTDRALVVVILAPLLLSIVAPAWPSQAFVRGAFAGAAVTMLARWVRSRYASQATVPLVRLPLRVDWITVTGILLLAVVLSVFEGSLTFPPELLSFALGLCGGFSCGLILLVLMYEQLDLCENGVVLRRIGFSPWSRVRVRRWNRNNDGRLVLWCGWNRVKARVAALDRDVVDAVLRANVTNEVALEQIEDGRHAEN